MDPESIKAYFKEIEDITPAMNCKNCTHYEPSSLLLLKNEEFVEVPADFGLCLKSKSIIKTLNLGHVTYHKHNELDGYKALISGDAIKVGKDFGCIHCELK